MLILAVLACAGRAIFFGQEPAPPVSVQLDFQGAVHTVLTLSQDLNVSPQAKQSHVLWITDRNGWLEFSQTGEIIAEGNVDARGKLLRTEHYQYDAEGNQIETTVTEGNKTTIHRWEVRTSQRGSTEFTETVEYVDGKPGSPSRIAYNPETGESRALDDNGEVLKRSIRLEKDGKTDSQFWIGKATFVFHHLERFDHKGNLVQSFSYNAEGEVISSLSFKDNALTSWWHAPKGPCSGSAKVHPDDQTMVFYAGWCGSGPELIKEVRRYLKPHSEADMTGEELYNENGKLLERIDYAYEFDEHHNWTRCVVSVMDWDTGMMVPVKEFIRKLSYYQSQLQTSSP
jgi:YD repeat-containing protein